jgi:hypothetical protein
MGATVIQFHYHNSLSLVPSDYATFVVMINLSMEKPSAVRFPQSIIVHFQRVFIRFPQVPRLVQYINPDSILAVCHYCDSSRSHFVLPIPGSSGE